MARRVLIGALAAVAILVTAAPAMAFNGYRSTYVLSGYCSTCHRVGGIAPPVYDEWATTAHANTQTVPISRGSGCAGCHVGNYDPSKHIPTAAGTTTFPTVAVGTQGSGTSAFSENFVGCSSCHQGANTGPDAVINDTFGTDPNDTAHQVPFTHLADPDICGQCHARYSATVNTYPAWSWATAQPAPVATTARPQGTLGDFAPLGGPPAWTPGVIADYLNIATATNPVGNTFWLGGQSTKAHGQGAVQYEEWMVTKHARSLDNLKTAIGPNPQARCLKCHSADYRMAVEAGRTPPTGAEAMYGVTCVGCHQPHKEGAQASVWNPAKNPQLKKPREELCIECHNSAIPVGESAKPGAEIHHPMREMMGGYGAIGVNGLPSVHSGRCVECHMAPTGYENSGSAGTAGNHIFRIVKPKEASSQTTTTATGVKQMPYSSCSTCHGRPNDPLATYLGGVIVDRQKWTSDAILRVQGLLDSGARKLGFRTAAKARAAILNTPRRRRTANQVNLLKGFTNMEFVASEGSLGIHNWPYTVAVVTKAAAQAKSVKSDHWMIARSVSRTSVAWGSSVTFAGKVTTSSLVPGRGKVIIQVKSGRSWSLLRTARLNVRGRFSQAIKMTSPGIRVFRVKMPGNATNLTAYSKTVKVVVR